MAFLITSDAVRIIYEGNNRLYGNNVPIKTEWKHYEILFKKVCKTKVKIVYRLCSFL